MTGKHYEARQCPAKHPHEPHTYLHRVKPIDLGRAFTCDGIYPANENLPGLEWAVQIVQDAIDKVDPDGPRRGEINGMLWIKDYIQAEIDYIKGEES